MNKLPGGVADKKSEKDFNPKSLEAGIKVELEHTDDRSIAKEIAMDHLTEDPKYYEKLKDIEKYDRVDVEADGKKELDYGKEELEKKPDVKARWKKLKKALNSDDAIMSIESQEYHDEEEGQEEGQEEAQQEELVDDQQEEAPAVEPSGEEDRDQQQVDEDEQAAEDTGEVEQPSGDDESQQLQAMLQDEGYSDAEIAYIVHGHMMPQGTVDDIKMDGEKQSNEHDQAIAEHELEHKKRMSDLEYDTATQEQGINELDKDHKKRMLDLEYETAQKEKEMELEYKQKELELKIQGKKQSHEVSMAAKKDMAMSRKMDAATTSKKEREGK